MSAESVHFYKNVGTVRGVCSSLQDCVPCHRNVFHTIDTLSEECVPDTKHSVGGVCCVQYTLSQRSVLHTIHVVSEECVLYNKHCVRGVCSVQ